MDVIYIDYEKAFDKVPHKRLLLKLEAIGIKGKALAWIRDWLRGRIYRVCVGNITSTEYDVTSGVLQGSVLFIHKMSDLGVGIKSQWNCFADDTKVVGIPEDDNENQLSSSYRMDFRMDVRIGYRGFGWNSDGLSDFWMGFGWIFG